MSKMEQKFRIKVEIDAIKVVLENSCPTKFLCLINPQQMPTIFDVKRKIVANLQISFEKVETLLSCLNTVHLFFQGYEVFDAEEVSILRDGDEVVLRLSNLDVSEKTISNPIPSTQQLPTSMVQSSTALTTPSLKRKRIESESSSSSSASTSSTKSSSSSSTSSNTSSSSSSSSASSSSIDSSSSSKHRLKDISGKKKIANSSSRPKPVVDVGSVWQFVKTGASLNANQQDFSGSHLSVTHSTKDTYSRSKQIKDKIIPDQRQNIATGSKITTQETNKTELRIESSPISTEGTIPVKSWVQLQNGLTIVFSLIYLHPVKNIPTVSELFEGTITSIRQSDRNLKAAPVVVSIKLKITTLSKNQRRKMVKKVKLGSPSSRTIDECYQILVDSNSDVHRDNSAAEGVYSFAWNEFNAIYSRDALLPVPISPESDPDVPVLLPDLDEDGDEGGKGDNTDILSMLQEKKQTFFA